MTLTDLHALILGLVSGGMLVLLSHMHGVGPRGEIAYWACVVAEIAVLAGVVVYFLDRSVERWFNTDS